MTRPENKKQGLTLRSLNDTDLKTELVNAIIDALDAHTVMSSQALGSDDIQAGLREILLGPAELYEKLRTSA